MYELFIRTTTPLVAAPEAGLGRPRPTTRLPGALVVHAFSASVARISALARRTGIPLVVDPETHPLQDAQPQTDRWTVFEWTPGRRCTPADLLASGRADALVATCLAH